MMICNKISRIKKSGTIPCFWCKHRKTLLPIARLTAPNRIAGHPARSAKSITDECLIAKYVAQALVPTNKKIAETPRMICNKNTLPLQALQKLSKKRKRIVTKRTRNEFF